MQVQQESWQARAKAKVASITSMIPTEWRLKEADLESAKQQRKLCGPFFEKFLDESDLDIIRNDSVQLVDKIKSRQYTAVAVTQTYCKAAAVAQQINNCLHEVMFDAAFKTARKLDEYYRVNGVVRGPLHGLPISLKDQFHVKGYDTTMGYVGWIDTYEGGSDPDKVHKTNSLVVDDLLELGAVLYCKLGETMNNIIGSTLNPMNQLLSCGGSSGGEAALQALRASSVGLGTDIGGSVRLPAAFCGTYCVKPTHDRLSYRDVANTNPGQDTYASSVGVMGTSLDAIKMVMSSLLSMKPWMRDPRVVKMPWDDDVEKSTLGRAMPDGSAIQGLHLKLGILWTDGVVTPHPPVARGLRVLNDLLKYKCHVVVDWKPPSHSEAKRIHSAFLKADGAHDIHHQLDLSGEPLIPPLRKGMQLREPTPLLEYQGLTIEGNKYNEAYCDYWNTTSNGDGQRVDAVIMPAAPHAAVIPGKFSHNAYTESINLMDYSVVVMPVTTADKSIDVFDHDYEPVNETDRMNWLAYDPEVYDGAPVGLQIVARKHEEEKVWAIAKIIDAALGTKAVDKA
ncbi:hypothetical protein ACLMJK_002274 [Lecanora helva]